MTNNANILIVDDNEEICEILSILLSKEGFSVQSTQDESNVFSLLSNSVDLIILDVMLPNKSGFEICSEIRKITMAPILFLTAKSQDVDKEIGFSCGGDDYIVKPFSSCELISRVKALLRRYFIYQGKNQFDSSDKIEIGELFVDFSEKSVFISGKEIRITDIEYKILNTLIKNRKKILSAKEIYESVWNEPFLPISNNTIMVHIKNLRSKIEKNHQNPKYITTVWGKGYQFD